MISVFVLMLAGMQTISKGNLVNEDGVPASTFYIEHPL